MATVGVKGLSVDIGNKHTDRQRDRQTDGRTDRRRDGHRYRPHHVGSYWEASKWLWPDLFVWTTGWDVWRLVDAQLTERKLSLSVVLLVVVSGGQWSTHGRCSLADRPLNVVVQGWHPRTTTDRSHQHSTTPHRRHRHCHVTRTLHTYRTSNTATKWTRSQAVASRPYCLSK